MSNNYIYPRVEFRQSNSGIIPKVTPWRSTIGVVGEFRRGPKLYKLRSAQEFAKLYGTDRSSGSKAIQQMLTQGVTDIIISRATSEETPSEFAIEFNNLNPNAEAKVGYEGNVVQYNAGNQVKTTGIELTAEVIGEALGSNLAFGEVKVSTTSRVNPDLEFQGATQLILGVRNRISNSVDLTTDLATAPTTNAYLAAFARTYSDGTTGTLSSLNADYTPQAAAPPLVNGDILALGEGNYLEIGVPTATQYTVRGASSFNVAVGQVALKASRLVVKSCPARLEYGSKLYYAFLEIGTVVKSVAPSSVQTVIYYVSSQSTQIPVASKIAAQAVLGYGKVTFTLGQTTVAQPYQYVKISKSLYPAVVSNLTPGRVLISKDPNLTLPNNYLRVLSNPLEDPLDSNSYRILVSGLATVPSANLNLPLNIALYETPANGYIFSTKLENELLDTVTPTNRHLRNLHYELETNTYVDTYVYVSEKYQSNNLTVDVLFSNSNGQIVARPLGTNIDLPQVANTGTVAFIEGTDYTVPIVRAKVGLGSLGEAGVPFATGTPADRILADLRTQILINSNLASLIADPKLSTALNPSTLSLTSALFGSQANRLNIKIRRETQGEDVLGNVFANDLMLNDPNPALASLNWSTPTTPKYHYFTGATRGATTAGLDLYSADSDLLVRVVALSDGAYGNKIQLSVIPISVGQFILKVVDLDSSSYQTVPTIETLNLSTRDVATNGIFNATANSSLIRAYYMPVVQGKQLSDLELDKLPERVAPEFGRVVPQLDYVEADGKPSVFAPARRGANYLENLFLRGGADAELEPDADSSGVGAAATIRAVKALEAEDIAYLLPVGFVMGDSRYASVIRECIEQVNRNSGLSLNRRLILQAPPNLSSTQAALYSAQLNNEDISLVAGYCSFSGLASSNLEPVSPIYAATLALSSPQYSPSYAGNGVVISGVGSTDILPTPQYLDDLTRAGVDALFYDSTLKIYKFLNGKTTSRDSRKQNVSIRRVAVQMMVDLYLNSTEFVSAPNQEQTWAMLSSSFDTYLSGRQAEGWIQQYYPTICDLSNNPLNTQSQNTLNATIRYVPYFPADQIFVNAIQQFSLSI